MKNHNQFRLETIYIKVKNIGESIHYMSNILGFKYIRSEVGEYGVKVFLESNSYDSKKSIMFCIEQGFYGDYKCALTFSLKPVNETNGESLIALKECIKLVEQDLENFVIANTTYEELRYAYMQNLESQYPFLNTINDNLFDNIQPDNNYPFSDSYLREIRIKVDSIARYNEVFNQLGFNVLPFEVDILGFRNMQVVLNDQCDITLRLIETTESLKDLKVNEYVSFEIVSNSHREGKGTTFIDLSDIGYCFTNEVFDEEDNVIAEHAELVTLDGINWRITEDSPVENFI
jgi:hypothetical protein